MPNLVELPEFKLSVLQYSGINFLPRRVDCRACHVVSGGNEITSCKEILPIPVSLGILANLLGRTTKRPDFSHCRPEQEEGLVLHMQYGDHSTDGVCHVGRGRTEVRIAAVSPGADIMQSARPDISIHVKIEASASRRTRSGACSSKLNIPKENLYSLRT